MLARAHRITEPSEIRFFGRGGKRVGSEYFSARCHQHDSSSPSRFAFVVSKNVGGAVVRNRVKRRLRSLAHNQLAKNPTGWDVVVRALPAAATASYGDLEKSWRDGFTTAMAS